MRALRARRSHARATCFRRWARSRRTSQRLESIALEQTLQWGAAVFYLLNKIFLWFSERAVRARKAAAARRWRILSWLVYLAGLPPWVAIFIAKHDWIAAA